MVAKRLLRIILLTILLSLFSYLLYLQQAGVLKNPTNGGLIDLTTNTSITSSLDEGFDEGAIEKEINNFRIENGMWELVRYEPLCELARIRVSEIKTDWSHNGFENRNEEIYTRFCNKDPIVCTGAGENLAKGDFTDEKDLIKGWIESPEHKDNILGNYNAQCVAVSETYYVSLFAYTENMDLINQQKFNELNSKVMYRYEKVMFWEKQGILNNKYESSWKSGYDNPHYKKEDLDKLIQTFKNKQDIANKLWDGYTNSKITNQEANDLEIEYWNLANRSAKISIELNKDAYNKCVNEGIGKDICKGYK